MSNPMIYPILCNANSKLVQQAFHIPFFSDDTKVDFPLITFAYITDDTEKSIYEPADINLSGGELVQMAFKNIRLAQLAWREETVDGHSLLIADGHPLAAEKILDQDFIKQASDTLCSEQLYIGIPHRGLILAVKEADQAILERKMASLLLNLRKEPLSDVIYRVEQGKLMGYQNITVKGSDALTELSASKLPQNVDHHISTIPLINGQYYITVLLGASSTEDLLDALYYFVQELFHKHILNPEFMGHIAFQTKVDAPQKTKALDQALGEFFRQMQQHPILQQNAKNYGASLKIMFLHGCDFQSGNMHLKQTYEIVN